MPIHLHLISCAWILVIAPVLFAEDAPKYRLTFNDEFNDGFNEERWNNTDYHAIRNNPGDYQAQWFSDQRSAPREFTAYNPFIPGEDGTLSIQADRTPKGAFSNGQPYVSGMMSTAHKFTQRYGYFELRTKLPAGSGLWSRFWLLTDNGAWPGEYDVFEVLGRDNSPDRNNYFAHQIRQTTHFWDRHAGHAVDGNQYRGINPFDGQFHTYGFLWKPDSVTWYVDGVATLRQANRIDIPMYVILDIAVGNNGNWPGQVDANTTFPARMEMDYFRVYSNDPSLPSVTPDSGYAPSPMLPAEVVLDPRPAAPQLPDGWVAGDVGKPDVPGSSTWNPTTGEWMLKGAGKAIHVNGQSQFARAPLAGDGAVVAAVTSLTDVVANEVRAGVSMRSAASMGSAEVSLFYKSSIPWPSMEYSTSLTLQYRDANGASMTEEVAIPAVAATTSTAPMTLRLARRGSEIAASYSPDSGASWLTVPFSRPLKLPGNVLAGIAMGGDGANNYKPARAIFNNVLVGPQHPVIIAPSDQVVIGERIALRAALLDPFASAPAKATSVVWSVIRGGGSITPNGVYTAPSSLGTGLATIKAVVDGIPVTRTVTLTLPENWTTPSLLRSPPGEITFDEDRWTITGGGTGISTTGGQDYFRFVPCLISGNETITARLDSTEGKQAGLMIRDFPSVNDRTVGAGSRYAGIWRTADGVQWAVRGKVGARAALVEQAPLPPGPVWLRLTRSGPAAGTFTAFFSTDGNKWTQIGSSQDLTLTDPAFAGLVVSSGSDMETNRSVFSQVRIASRRAGSPNVAIPATCPAKTGPSPAQIKDKKATLLVLGADDKGEPALTYTWTATGPGAVTFSANGTNEAKNSTASFSAAGIYCLTATITDADKLSVVSSVSIRVQ